jgi:hypothetical protein
MVCRTHLSRLRLVRPLALLQLLSQGKGVLVDDGAAGGALGRARQAPTSVADQ